MVDQNSSDLAPKISIIGCGSVGMAYAYASVIRGIARSLVLIDIDKQRLEGEVLDLNHTAPFTSAIDIQVGEYSEIKNSDLIVITAGKSQEPGETRLDIADKNVELFKEIIPIIYKYAPESIYLIVSNPVDILSYVTYKISGKNHQEIIGSGTTLDTARLRFKLSKHCKIDPRNIHAYILGEHGDSEVPIWSRAMIGGLLFGEYCKICNYRHSCKHEQVLSDVFKAVRDSAYKIIDKKGETSYGIGLALVRISQAILNNENAILPVSGLVQNYLGIDEIYLSLPRILNKNGIKATLHLNLNSKEEENLKKSAQTLNKIILNLTIK
ncbi:MAG: L-lactate dehydrogenase [Promethearchaeota archaeon]|nr:MAG: L-lactate dehydrogenase [Candidatus Lokiarchaeota archaeon]